MSAFTIVRFQAKPDQVEAFERAYCGIDRTMPGLKRFVLVKTGDRSYCSIGEFESFDHIVSARTTMRANLDTFRHHLEPFDEALGVTDAVSGDAMLDVHR
jgi:hypothetical protein